MFKLLFDLIKNIINPYLLIGAFVLMLISWCFGYKVANAKNKKIIDNQTIAVFKEIKNIEKENNLKIEEVVNEYQTKIKLIDTANSPRLRVRTCSRLPTNTSAARIDATDQRRFDGGSTSELNFDGYAKRIVEIGVDLDKANATIESLQKIVKICENPM